MLLSPVLAHVPDPAALLVSIAPRLSPASGVLCVEVPLERPWLGFLSRGRFGRAWLGAVRRFPVLLRGLDSYSTSSRVKVGILPPLGFPKLHERVHASSSSSLACALEKAVLEIICLEETIRPWVGHGTRAGLPGRLAAGRSLPWPGHEASPRSESRRLA